MTSLPQFIKENEITLVTLPLPLDIPSASLILAHQSNSPYFIITWEVLPTQKLSASPDRILSYTDLEKIREVENSVLIFDSLPHVQETLELDEGAIEGWAVIEHLRSNGNRILILSTFVEFDPERLQLLPSSVVHLYLEFANCGQLKFRVEPTIMTKEQLKAFKEERDSERKDKSQYKKETYSSSQQYCNILYPKAIHKIMSKGSNFQKRNLNLENAFAIYGLTDLLRNSPKFKKLLVFLFENRNEKHLILTRYRRFAGLEILSIFLRALQLPCYELTSSTPDKFQLCEQFSEAKEGVLLCTLVPPSGLKGVKHLHLLDGSLGNFDDLLNLLFKHRYSQGETSLTVHNHITVSSEISTPDTLGYAKFYEKMERKMKLWEGIVSQGKRVVAIGERIEIAN